MAILPARQFVMRFLAVAVTLTAILAATAPARILAQSDRADPAAGTPVLVAIGNESATSADSPTRKSAEIAAANHHRAPSSKPATNTMPSDGRTLIFGLLIVGAAQNGPFGRFK
jgi:hypothetical protein